MIVYMQKGRAPTGSYLKLKKKKKTEPFRILHRIGDNVYVLVLPPEL